MNLKDYNEGWQEGYMKGLEAGVRATRDQLWQDLIDLGSTGDHYEARMDAVKALFFPAEVKEKPE